MLPTTIKIIRAGLEGDPTVDPGERERLVRLLREPKQPKPSLAAPNSQKVLSREEVAEKLNCSLRLVDRLAKQGVLRRVVLPNRSRAIGFDEVSVNALFEDRTKAESL